MATPSISLFPYIVMSDLLEQATRQFEDLEFSPSDGSDLIVAGKRICEARREIDTAPSFVLILEKHNGYRCVMTPPDLTGIPEDRVYAFLGHLRTTLLPAMGVVRVAEVLINRNRFEHPTSLVRGFPAILAAIRGYRETARW